MSMKLTVEQVRNANMKVGPTVFGMTLDEVREMMKRDAERNRTCELKATTAGWSCTACHVVNWQTIMKPKPNYCPNCGAKVVEQ